MDVHAALVEDFRFYREQRGSGRLALAGFLLHPSSAALVLMRISARGGLVGRLARRALVKRFGCDVQAGARLGPALHLPHPLGIVIGGQAVVGSRCVLYHGVTLGIGQGDGMPTLGDEVKVYAGAVLAGPIHVGDYAVVRALSLLTRDMPAPER